jgi:hypothetical protein
MTTTRRPMTTYVTCIQRGGYGSVQAAARVWFERGRFVSPGSESRWTAPCFEGLVPAR